MASDSMGEALGRGAEARKMALSLKHVTYGGELHSKLMECSNTMETLYHQFHELGSKGRFDEPKAKQLIAKTADHLKWWEKAKVGPLKKGFAF